MGNKGFSLSSIVIELLMNSFISSDDGIAQYTGNGIEDGIA